MKKVFFAALLAVVAIGGAVSTSSALTVYNAGGTQTFICTSGPVLCSTAIGSQPVYLIKGPVGSQGTAVNPASYSGLGRAN